MRPGSFQLPWVSNKFFCQQGKADVRTNRLQTLKTTPKVVLVRQDRNGSGSRIFILTSQGDAVQIGPENPFGRRGFFHFGKDT